MFQRKYSDDLDFETRLLLLTKKVERLETELKNKANILPIMVIESESEIEPESEQEHEPEVDLTAKTKIEPQEDLKPISEYVLDPEPRSSNSDFKTEVETQSNPIDKKPKPLSVYVSKQLQEKELEKDAFSIEKHIGLCWLNRIGTISLVLGVALFIIYSFQSSGPFLKLAVGALTGIVLLSWGEIFEKSKQHEEISFADKFWGRSLMGGGWALIYFTGYASYHIDGAKILSNLILEDILLTTICLSALNHACGKNSQIMATMVILLSFTTILFSEIGIGTVYWILALGVRALPACSSMGWFGLLLITTALGYGSYATVIEQHLPTESIGFFNNLGKLIGMTLFWMSCNSATIGAIRQTVSDSRLLGLTTLFNGLCIIWIATGLLQNIQGTLQLDYLAPLLIGSFYCFTYRPSIKPNLVSLASLRLTMGMWFITYAMSLAGQTLEWQTNYWLIQIVLFIAIGARLEISLMRNFAYALAGYTGLQKIGLFMEAPYTNAYLQAFFTSSIFYASWQSHKMNPFLSSLHGRNYLFWAFQLFAWLTPFVGALQMYQSTCAQAVIGQIFGWLILYSAFLQVCLKSQTPMWRMAVAIGFGLAAAYSLQIEYNPIVTSTIALTYLVSALICHFNKKALGALDAKFLYRLFIAAFAVLTWYHTQSLKGFFTDFLALKWSLESLALIGMGYALKDSFARYVGFLGFGLVTITCFMNSSSLNSTETSFVILVLYALGQLYRKTRGKHLQKDEHVLANCFESAGTLITAISIWQLVPSQYIPIALASQSLILLLYGILLRDKPFYLSSMTVCILWGAKSFYTTNSVLLSILLVAIVSIQACIASLSANRIGIRISKMLYEFFMLSSAIACGTHTYFHAHGDFNYLALKWAGEAGILFAIGYANRNNFTRNTANVWLAITGYFLASHMGPWHSMEMIAIIALFYTIGTVYRFSNRKLIESSEKTFCHYFEVSANILLSLALWDLMPSEWLTASLALQGFLLLAIGFILPDRAFRYSGLTVFLLLGTKLLMDDFICARTDVRILSVIWAGSVLIASSFMYAKWGWRLKQVNKDTSANSAASPAQCVE
ncbi:MAG: DUF2339 domain-containing protein [Cyanobacteria bacterium TGS_CYA1]|nr:DUF2339 domain-containing protein [Cyanobacteria bacterium TGS_CYA1]